MTNTNLTNLLENSTEYPKVGQSIDGIIIAIDKNAIYVDLSPFGTGIIFGREYFIVADLIKTLKPGDKVTTKIKEFEGENGYIELSLKDAREAVVWNEAQEAMDNKKTLTITVKEANKGGLMLNWRGLTGFLPASQLSPENYPKISNGDSTKVLNALKKLVGKRLDVRIITVDKKENKIVFSEKSITDDETDEEIKQEENISTIEDFSNNSNNIMQEYSVGDVLDSVITGIVDFGIFVRLESGKEGLVHISEISWSLVDDPKKLYKVGDKIKVKVIEVDRSKVSLSIKALSDNPWKKALGKYKKGDEVNGVIIKISSHGALASVEEGIYGLVHVSEFKDIDELKSKLKLGQVYKFIVNVFDTVTEKMTLVMNKESLNKPKPEKKD